MWSVNTSEIAPNRLHLELFEDERSVSFERLLQLWDQNAEFRTFWTQQLTSPKWTGLRWETPPITASTVDRSFECILIRSDALERRPDTNAFQAHFEAEDVIAFDNLSGDATLVVPCPMNSETNYVHLLSFLRSAGDQQTHALWSMTANTVRSRLNDRPIWLSTAGMGGRMVAYPN